MVVNNQAVMGQADQWEHDARVAIEPNIPAFNAHDRRAYWGAYNYPLISVAPNGKVATRATTAEDAEKLIREGQPDFTDIQKEGWVYSTLDRVAAIDVSATKVHFLSSIHTTLEERCRVPVRSRPLDRDTSKWALGHTGAINTSGSPPC